MVLRLSKSYMSVNVVPCICDVQLGFLKRSARAVSSSVVMVQSVSVMVMMMIVFIVMVQLFWFLVSFFRMGFA